MRLLQKLLRIPDNTNVTDEPSNPIEGYVSKTLAMRYISSKEAATILGVNDSRVRQLLLAGILSGRKFGPVWLVSKASVNKYALTDRKPGPKPK